MELAQGGPLFLDEIGDPSFEQRTKLLRLFDQYVFTRVGGTQILTADVRMVAATNRDLEAMVEADSLRSDLYFRWCTFQATIPPLRHRREDIPALALHFAGRMAARPERPGPRVSAATLPALAALDWPASRNCAACRSSRTTGRTPWYSARRASARATCCPWYRASTSSASGPSTRCAKH